MSPMLTEIPGWVLQEIRSWMEMKRTGWLKLNVRRGDIRHVEREELVFGPETVRSTTTEPVCPSCGMVMEQHDYGNMWLCRCGTKRTKAQLAVEQREKAG